MSDSLKNLALVLLELNTPIETVNILSEVYDLPQTDQVNLYSFCLFKSKNLVK